MFLLLLLLALALISCKSENNIQAVARQVSEEIMEQYEPLEGVITLVADAKTGDIIASADLGGTGDNRAETYTYEPGSVFRIFSISSAMFLPDGTIDDYVSMREVIARRYTRIQNDNLNPPDLILVDGGKGQLNAATKILRILGMDSIPVAGLAEKNEEIFIPGRKDAIVLPRTSDALKILQNVRDEAHRFANRFNKQLLKKDITDVKIAAEADPEYGIR